MGNRWYVGVDVGGTTIKLGIFDTQANDFCKKWEIPTNTENNGESIVSDLVFSIKETCSEVGISYNELCGIGIDVPGPVNDEGFVYECVNLGWKEVDLYTKLKELSGISNIVIGNDANVAALGEMWRGDLGGCDSVVMVTLGTAVGGGVIINGKIHSGSKGAGGEIGHITVNPDEPDSCGCGMHGCLEQYSSATGIVRLAKQMMNLDADSKITAKDIADAAKAGDEEAGKVFDTAMKYLGIALSNVANVVDPQAFIIGGGVSKAGSMITDAVSKYYNMYSMKSLQGRKFFLAKLGNDAGIYGCIKLVLENNQ